MIQTASTTTNNSMNMSVCSTLKLNNDAVNYLQSGDFVSSASTLRAAIKSLERCFLLAASSPTSSSETHSCSEPPKKRRRTTATPVVTSAAPTTTTASSASASNKPGFVAVRSITVSKCVKVEAAATDDSSSSCEDDEAEYDADISLLMIYDRAFDFPTLKEDEDGDIDISSQQSKTRLAAILLYNLGLSYQRQAIRTGCSKDLKLALKFYREAYMVLKSAWAKTSNFQEVFVLLLALLNNMACIHVYMGDGNDTHQCINWMNRAIASRQRSILSKEDYTFFSLNLSVFGAHQLKLASAA